MRTMQITLSVGALAAIAALASAQPWANNYAVGEGPVFNPAWDPGSPVYLMSNLGGNIYGIDIVAQGDGAGAYNRFQWKVSDGTWSNTAPANVPDNAYGRATNGATVGLRCDFNSYGDGFIPDVGVNAQNGILFTVPKVWNGASKVILAGDFNGWDNSYASTWELKDDGVSPDVTAGDGIYSGQFSIAAGSYGYLVLPCFGTDNGSWDLKLSQRGISAGGNLQLVVTGTDPITFYVDTNKGRVKAVSSAPPITYPCALSSAWSTVPGPDTQLFDDGTNGDAVAGDGIYARVFTVTNPAAGGIDKVNVLLSGNTYPSTGGYPFNSFAGAQVIVSFDTNTYSDGYLPNTKIVWVNPSKRILPGDPNGPTGVHVTGDFVSDLGGSNWNPGDPLMQLFDNGAGGDTVAGDRIYTLTIPGAIVPTMSGKQWKATGGSWDWQYGSPDNGFTLNGNNPNMTLNTTAAQDLQFKVDAITGRAGYGQPTAAEPVRPGNAVLNNSSGVADWQLF